MEPPLMLALSGSSRRREKAMEVLPQPDSPGVPFLHVEADVIDGRDFSLGGFVVHGQVFDL
jgi:hypothetical protein